MSETEFEKSKFRSPMSELGIREGSDRLLPSAFCLPPSAFCLPPSAFRLPPSAFRLLPSAFCLLISDP